tara:strand:+ start:6235 stop:6513 length:279 start_codon:yes stop_codon:yes gene_type:complete
MSNGFSINSVFSTQILETSKEFYFTTYLPQTTINLRYEFVFEPAEYKEKINNLSFFSGVAASFTFNRVSIGYGFKSSFSIIESKHINSFSNG